MPFIYLTVQTVKYANKKYKQHKLKKDLQEKGQHPWDLLDPSDELVATTAYGVVELPPTPAYQQDETRSRSSSNHTTHNPPHYSSLPQQTPPYPSTSTTPTPDLDLTIESDLEFQHYMYRQKLLFLEHRRTSNSNRASTISSNRTSTISNSSSSISSSPMDLSPVSPVTNPPPSYDTVMAQQQQQQQQQQRDCDWDEGYVDPREYPTIAELPASLVRVR